MRFRLPFTTANTPRETRSAGGGILRRLLRDARGATLPMMGFALIPLAGFVGSAVDMSRLYITKTRLQTACDAGALAGRRMQGGGAWNAASLQQAEQFFDVNFANGAFGTTNRARAFVESAGRVTGTASAVVPMTIMKIFYKQPVPIAVACSAEMRLPNTDIMFVLDTTGSMANAIPGETETKMAVLREATNCFFEIVARQPTAADCGPDPTGGLSGQTQVRFGFVPYSTNVNVGRLLPTNFMADRWFYQSRRPILVDQTYWAFESENGTPSVTGSYYDDVVYGNWQSVTTFANQTSDECAARKPADGTPTAAGSESAPQNVQESISGSSRTVTWTTRQPQRLEWLYQAYRRDGSGPRTCYVERRVVTGDLVRSYRRVDSGTERTRQVFDRWRYERLEHNIAGLKNGTNWNTSVSLPIGAAGAMTPVAWDGCIEERATEKLTDYTNSTALDLDIDTVPSVTVPNSHWGPALRTAVFTRGSGGGLNSDNYRYDPFETTSNYGNPVLDDLTRNDDDATYFCPTPARRLQTWDTAAEFENYVNSLTPTGNTHHDIGMIWGARLMSPTGIFAADNATTPGGGQIERHMIFMTDGQTCTNNRNYAAYGLPWFDRRQTAVGSVPTHGCSEGNDTGGTLSQQVDARFAALCTAVRARNITLWVVYFGTTDATTTTRMTRCASNYNPATNTSDRFFAASNSAALMQSFRVIASQISQLRLTQ